MGTQPLLWYCMRGQREVSTHLCDHLEHETRLRPCTGDPCPQAPRFLDSAHADEVEIVPVQLQQPAEVHCYVEGHPPPTVSWSWNNPDKHQHFEAQKKLGIMQELRRGQVLRILSVSRELEGRFTCTARNSLGLQASAHKSLVVQRPPRFEVDPAGEGLLHFSVSCYTACCCNVAQHLHIFWLYRAQIIS